MSFMADVAQWSVVFFGVLLFAIQVGAHGLGYWLGDRDRAKAKAEGQSDSVGIVVGGMLGLLAFVLALTLSFASTRFDERRERTFAEATAISTAWFRAEAIGHPRGEAIAKLLVEYVPVRITFVKAGRNMPEIGESLEKTGVLQSAVEGHVAALVRERPDAVVSSLMAAVNEAFDDASATRFAFEIQLPPQLFWLLIGMTLLSMGGLGYQLGIRGREQRLLVMLLTAMWTTVIVDILDLASSRLGFYRADIAPYTWALEGMKDGLPIPPPSP
jgi:hypothetical protein